MKKELTFKDILSIILMLGGAFLVKDSGGWELLFGIAFLIWANNLSIKEDA